MSVVACTPDSGWKCYCTAVPGHAAAALLGYKWVQVSAKPVLSWIRHRRGGGWESLSPPAWWVLEGDPAPPAPGLAWLICRLPGYTWDPTKPALTRPAGEGPSATPSPPLLVSCPRLQGRAGPLPALLSPRSATPWGPGPRGLLLRPACRTRHSAPGTRPPHSAHPSHSFPSGASVSSPVRWDR